MALLVVGCRPRISTVDVGSSTNVASEAFRLDSAWLGRRRGRRGSRGLELSPDATIAGLSVRN